ncbi:MAG: peptidylprolyl isomerase [Fidelibacterota bacterium]
MTVNRSVLLIAGVITGCLWAQLAEKPQIIEGIAAVVGDNVILKSDVSQLSSMTAMQQKIDPNREPEKYRRLQEEVLQSLIDQKIMLEMAKLDSVEVEDKEVDSALDQQIQNIIAQAGSEERAEEMMGQSLKSFRREFWQDMHDRLVTGRYQQQLMDDIKVTRQEVIQFFETYKDSLPPFPTEVKLRHILIPIKPSQSSRARALSLLDSLRAEILIQGQSFEDLARKFSQDPGTRDRGGDLGFVRRGTLVPEFESVAFTLPIGEISEPVETLFGYHLIQTREIKGDRIHVRHILIQPKITDEDDSRTYEEARLIADSIKTLDTFKEFAQRYSSDEQTSGIGGDLGWVDPNNFSIPELAQVVPYLEKGKCSLPVKTDFGYHLLWLEDVRPGGKPDLVIHWAQIEEMALNRKKMDWFQSWIKSARERFSIVLAN